MLRIVRITTFISFDICNKCDQIKCSRDSQLWRIFRGCGHSFHLECNLPDISACPICQDLLKSKAESLGKTTNDAVKNFKTNLLKVQQIATRRRVMTRKIPETTRNTASYSNQQTKNTTLRVFFPKLPRGNMFRHQPIEHRCCESYF